MGAEVRALLARMRASRRDVVERLAGLMEADMSRQTTWAQAPADVRFMLLRFADHEEEHALQIERMLGAAGFRQSKAQLALSAAAMTRGDLLAALVGLEEADLDVAPEGEWPLRRILAHMIRTEDRYTLTTLYAVTRYRQGLAWEAPPEDALPPQVGESDELLGGTFAEYIAWLDEARDRALEELPSVPDTDLVARTVWNHRNVSAEFRLLRFAHHEREHVAHINKWRHQVGRVPTEAEHLLGLGWRARGYLESRLVGVPDALLDQASPTGDGTIRAILEHIMDSERMLTERIQGATPVA